MYRFEFFPFTITPGPSLWYSHHGWQGVFFKWCYSSREAVGTIRDRLDRALNSIYLSIQGPIAIFNSKNQWAAPRTVVLRRLPTEGFGFSVRGDSPVIVADIEPDSVAGVSSTFVIILCFGDYGCVLGQTLLWWLWMCAWSDFTVVIVDVCLVRLYCGDCGCVFGQTLLWWLWMRVWSDFTMVIVDACLVRLYCVDACLVRLYCGDYGCLFSKSLLCSGVEVGGGGG